MSQIPNREPGVVDAPPRMTVPRELEYPVRAQGRSTNIHRPFIGGQRTSALGRNPSIESNFSIASGNSFVSDKNPRIARGLALSIPGHRSGSVDAFPFHPTPVTRNLQPAPIQHSTTQRSGTPETQASNPPAMDQDLPPSSSQYHSETQDSFVGPARTGSRPTGTIVVTSRSFRILTGGQEPDF